MHKLQPEICMFMPVYHVFLKHGLVFVSRYHLLQVCKMGMFRSEFSYGHQYEARRQTERESHNDVSEGKSKNKHTEPNMTYICCLAPK